MTVPLFRGLGDVAKMHNALREKASPLGANAVVLLEHWFGHDPIFGGTYRGYTAVAVIRH